MVTVFVSDLPRYVAITVRVPVVVPVVQVTNPVVLIVAIEEAGLISQVLIVVTVWDELSA
jgi:hypothetical protein